MLAPCKGCKDRVLGCHSDCERYLEFSRENERIKEQRRKDSDLLSRKKRVLTCDGYWR